VIDLGRRRQALAVGAIAVVAAGCGTAAGPSPSGPAVTPAGEPSVGPVEIAISLSDAFRMEPAAVSVTSGSTVRFVLMNEGVLDHEFFIGDAAAQDEHEAEMQAGGMQHDEPDGVSVAAGSTKTFEYTFEAPGELLAGCHVSGHYAAGMKATITVSP